VAPPTTTPGVAAAPPASSASAAPAPSNAPTAPVPPKVGDGYLYTFVLNATIRMTAGFAPQAPETLDLKGTVLQEMRFKVASVDAAKISALTLDYGKCSIEVSGRGLTKAVPMPTDGKFYRVAVGERELGVSSRADKPVSDEEVEDVREDARAYLALDEELRRATANAAPPSDLHAMSRIFPVQDNPVKLTENKVVFRRFVAGKDGGQRADYDFAVALEGSMAEASLQGRLAGSMLLATNPWRPLSVKGSGPISVGGADADFAANGAGTLSLEITYAR